MRCKMVQESLSSSIDNETNTPDWDRIDLHLKECSSCLDYYSRLNVMRTELRHALPISTPSSLDSHVISAFGMFHDGATEKTRAKSPAKTASWFGIPRFAFAGALVSFLVVGGLSFQLGKTFASKSVMSQPIVSKNEGEFSNRVPAEEIIPKETPKNQTVETKIVEVPVYKERIVKVPVVKEKIITRVVYRYRKDVDSRQNDQEINSNLKNQNTVGSKYESGFELVKELKPQVTKIRRNK